MLVLKIFLYGGSDGIDVTGGMRQKIEKMIKLSESGIKIRIINGLVEGNIKDSILGINVKGTLIQF